MARLDIAHMLASFRMERLFLMVLWHLIIHLRPDIGDEENRVDPVRTRRLLAEYDYVIIGGGSAGVVLASRLSEDPDRTVLLLEAGTDEIALSDVPLTFPLLQRTYLDWQFKTEPSSEYCLAMMDRQCRWPRGKVLGGSSVLNAMLYVRGNKRDYDRWAEAGNPGWDYRSVLPYFMKSEDARADELAGSPYHRRGGYMTIERIRYDPPLTDYIVHAGRELGYEVRDVNGANQTGFTYSYGTLRDGLRCSSAKSFLRPASKRRNLHVSLESEAERILIRKDASTPVAYGAIFRRAAKYFAVRARREVIVSAGAVLSPKLLMLSGIGPRSHLRQMKVPLVRHAPGVGRNLQDHVAIGGVVCVIDPPSDAARPDRFAFKLLESVTMDSLQEFIWNSTGPLYMIPISSGMAFINTKYANETIDYPDVQLLLSVFSDTSDSGLFATYINNIDVDLLGSLYENITENVTFAVYPLLLRPRSRGYIRLRSADPNEPPAIVPNYFHDPRDLEVLVEGVKFIERLTRTSVMRRLNTRLNRNRIPGCSQFDGDSREYWACHARHLTMTIYHPVGSCKMGPASDSEAVVDARLRVHGIARLRVIDASIMPNIVSGNTNAPTIMIAEKGADMIKEDWRRAI